MMIDYKGMIIIHGDLFELDSTKEFLVDHQNKANRCKLEDLLVARNTYVGLYDPQKRKIIPKKGNKDNSTEMEKLKPFRLPVRMVQKNIKLSEETMRAYNRACIKEKRGVQYVTPELSGRLNGQPAEILIDELRYVVDLKKMEIRQKENAHLSFHFSRQATHHPTTLFYNTETKMPLLFPDLGNGGDEHIMRLEFGKLAMLDPIGYCIANGYPPAWPVCDFQWDHIDKAIPLLALNHLDQEGYGIESEMNYEGMLLIPGELLRFSDSRNELITASGKELPLSGLDRIEGFYTGRYDKQTQTFHKDGPQLKLHERIFWQLFKIPFAIVENRSLGPRTIDWHNRNGLRNQNQCLLIDKNLSDRLNGKLPVIRFDGLDWQIDIFNYEIRQVQHPNVKFNLSQESYYCDTVHFYQPQTKEPLQINHKITEIPKDVVAIGIPNFEKLDLVGFNLMRGDPILRKLTQYHWKPEPGDINVRNLMQTNIPELVRRNQIEQESQGIIKGPQQKTSQQHNKRPKRKGLK